MLTVYFMVLSVTPDLGFLLVITRRLSRFPGLGRDRVRKNARLVRGVGGPFTSSGFRSGRRRCHWRVAAGVLFFGGSRRVLLPSFDVPRQRLLAFDEFPDCLADVGAMELACRLHDFRLRSVVHPDGCFTGRRDCQAAF